MLSVMTVCEVYSMVTYGIQSLIHTGLIVFWFFFLAAAHHAGPNANFSSSSTRHWCQFQKDFEAARAALNSTSKLIISSKQFEFNDLSHNCSLTHQKNKQSIPPALTDFCRLSQGLHSFYFAKSYSLVWSRTWVIN